MIVLKERLHQYKSRKIGDVIEYDNQFYVCVEIGKTRVANNGEILTNIVGQSVEESDSSFELESAYSRPRTFQKAMYHNISIGDFASVEGGIGRVVRLVGIASFEWLFTDLKVSWVAEPVQPFPRQEVIRLIKEYKKKGLHKLYSSTSQNNVIQLNFKAK